jgi:hypothetical protein
MERSRPERRDMPAGVVPGRREREDRRAPAAAAPSVKGAAAREGQERGESRARRDERGDGNKARPTN